MSSIQSDVSRRKIIRIKISKACNQTISLSLEDLINLQREYDIISEKCLAASPDDYDEQKSKDDLYKQKISALISLEQTKNTLSAISIIDEEIEDFLNIPNTVQASTPVMNASNSIDENSTNPSYPMNVRASDLLTFDGNVLNWHPFKISFEDEVINNPNLMESKKRNLLLKVLENDAKDRAMDLVRQGQTLRSIWISLNAYYGDPKKADEYLLKRIRSIVYVNTSFESSKIEIMLNEVRRISSAANSLGAAYVSRSNSLVKEVLWRCGRQLREKLAHVESFVELVAKLEKLYKSALCLDTFERRDSVRPTTVAAAFSVCCIFCNGSHASADCSSSVSTEEKRRIILARRLCFKCISPGHRSSSCPHALSILDPIDPSESSESSVTTIPDRSLVARYDGAASTSTTSERPAFLINLNGRKCMVWIDTCSPYTLIRENLVNKFDCFPDKPICLSGFAGGSVIWSKEKVSVNLHSDKISVTIDAYVISVLSYCDLIIGTDMLHRITKIGPSKSLKWELKFGDIYYGSVASSKEIDNNIYSEKDVEEELLNKLVSRSQTQNFYDRYREDFMSFVSSGQVVEINDTVGCMNNLLFKSIMEKDRIQKRISDTSSSVYGIPGFSNSVNIFNRSFSLHDLLRRLTGFFTNLWREKLLNYGLF
ncbi:hypothetical protein DERP_000521 [Dermatophagoides pteronyssinus]|uniref:CCHC-type domain-containing protein n=1 Tax=Dermatophagoides pteronyssinus TaxID=6956 RepID=A0ABQ8J0X9_DERPT|nr:hypothetical protein DERP_000521 [Dermatophagoides pteronyssinus]